MMVSTTYEELDNVNLRIQQVEVLQLKGSVSQQVKETPQ